MATRKTRSRRQRKPSDVLSPEVIWYLESRGYKLRDDCVPQVMTPEPVNVPGALFDPARVDRVIAALKRMTHTQGKWAGHSLAPDAWQVAYVLAPVFGWVAPNEDGLVVRIIKSVFVEVPRKNGKTTLTAALLLYLAFADGEPGAQVFAVASGKDQAKNAYNPAKALANRAPALKAAKIRGKRDIIDQVGSDSFIQVLAGEGDAIHGKNVSGACVDELHTHKSADVLDAVESGTGARDQPLVVVITTAGDGKPESVYEHRRAMIDKLAKGVFKEASMFGVVFAADKGDDPHAESTWRKANPGLGISPTLAFLRAESNKAKNSDADLAKYLRLHLGIRTSERKGYIPLPLWDRNKAKIDRTKLAGREAWGGLDLASTSDLCALCWLFPDPEQDGKFDAIWRFWVPEAAIEALDKRTAGGASVWVKKGLLTVTPGNVTDYDYIVRDIGLDRETYDVQSLGYDPYGALSLVNKLQETDTPLVVIRQGYLTLSPALKEVQRTLLSATERHPALRHEDDPVIRWMIDNLAVEMDAAGNVKPSRRTSADKIDGVAALTMAMSEAMTRPTEARSAYEDADLAAV